VLRRCALAERAVSFRSGVGVAGLLADTGTAPLRVRGVRLDDGTPLTADLVVASAGRRCAVPEWFADIGVAIPEEEHPTGTVYLSRFYRTADGTNLPMGYHGGRRAGLGFVIAGADNGTYSATLAVPTDDGELRAHLLDEDRFEAVLPLFREMAPIVALGGTPLTSVQVMGGLINRIRRYLAPDGTPLAQGFFAIGDSHTCTNPLYGRGSSLAVLQAVLVADALTAHPDDADAAARAYETTSALRVEPWYHVSVASDGGVSDGAPRVDLGALRRIAATGDPELALLVVRMMSLLVSPQEVFDDPAVLERLHSAASTERPRDPTKPPRVPLTRDDLLAAGRDASV
jgi:2-polyprenyl-6-methoxyphenol hydroxylase-like FAD-dependent oxidoreductase